MARHLNASIRAFAAADLRTRESRAVRSRKTLEKWTLAGFTGKIRFKSSGSRASGRNHRKEGLKRRI